MIFVYLCIFVFVLIMTIVGSILFGMATSMSTDLDDWLLNSWIMSTFGFALCLVYIIFKNGLI